MLGQAAGVVIAPIPYAVSWLRRARTFHPRGVVHRAEVAPHPAVAVDLASLARRLAGPALARLSSAWWKRAELPDVLGIALRLRANDVEDPRAHELDQDLLFATIRVPITTPIAPLSTDQHDFLGNDYWAVSPFRIDGVGRARLRLRPRREADGDGDRAERLARAIAQGRATFDLELRRAPRLAYEPLVTVTLGDAIDVDQEALAFSPFREGRGIRPIGFVHGLRAATYAASRRARHRRAR